jgi:hypothetical protein
MRSPHAIPRTVPLPDAQQPLQAEIRLKLDKPLAGKPELNAEFQWEGVASAFTRQPFMATMDVETSKLQGLKTAPCARHPLKSLSAGKRLRSAPITHVVRQRDFLRRSPISINGRDIGEYHREGFG